MNVKSVEKQEKSTVELVIEVSREEFDAAIEKVYKKQRNKINVPGFRKGHAPRKIIEGMYGSGVFYEDAINESYYDYYRQAVDQEKLDVVAWPKVEMVEVGKEGYTFKAIVTVKPEVTLGEYKGLTAEKDEVTVTDEDVENELKPFIRRATRMVTVEREAQLGDTVVIDYEGFLEGKPFDGGKADGHSLELGSGSFVPGFEDQLVGMKAGEERDIDITFPENYHAELAGKAVVFHVKVNEVKEAQAPVVDDEFAKDVSEFDTLEAFKDSLRSQVQTRREDQAERAYGESLIGQAVENMQVDIPDAMVDYRADQMLDDMMQRMGAQGINMEQYMSMTGMDGESLKENARSTALGQIRRELLLDAVIAAEGLTVGEEELEEEYKKMAETYRMDVEKVKELVSAEDVGSSLKNRKAERLIIENGKIGKAPADKKEEAAEGEEKPKTTTRKKAEAAEGEERPKKTTRKKAETAEGEEKPKKTTTRKKAEAAEGEEKPKKTTTRKKAEEKTEE